jgi:hypothetical protein
MATMVGNVIGGGMDRLVARVILPVTGLIPVLARTGLLFLGFAALWLALLGAVVLDPASVDGAWRAIGGWPVLLQGAAWLLFLPVMAGLWAWTTDWPELVRVALVLSIAGWNLLVLVPRREPAAPSARN